MKALNNNAVDDFCSSELKALSSDTQYGAVYHTYDFPNDNTKNYFVLSICYQKNCRCFHARVQH